MSITVSEIVRRVRSAIDELMANDSGFLNQSEDEANLTTAIKDKIAAALTYVVDNAPLDKLDGSMIKKLTTSGSNFSINSTTKVARVILPDTILRVVTARLSSWTQSPIPEPDTSETALMQSDEYARGSWDRPVNILSYDQGQRVLEMYCAQTTSDTLTLLYVDKPTVANTNDATSVDVPTLLEGAFIYQVAGLAMVAFKDEAAASLLAISEKMIGRES